MTIIHNEAEALSLLIRGGFLGVAAEVEVRRVPVGFRTAGQSAAFGSSDLVVTVDGRILRIPSMLPDGAIPT